MSHVAQHLVLELQQEAVVLLHLLGGVHHEGPDQVGTVGFVADPHGARDGPKMQVVLIAVRGDGGGPQNTKTQDFNPKRGQGLGEGGVEGGLKGRTRKKSTWRRRRAPQRCHHPNFGEKLSRKILVDYIKGKMKKLC